MRHNVFAIRVVNRSFRLDADVDGGCDSQFYNAHHHTFIFSDATNIRVGVGGAYYIISRSLGLEICGAIGVPLFLSQTFSVTLYSFGLAESLAIVWPGVPVQKVTFVIVIAVGLLALSGAKKTLKTQVPIMILIAISLVALTTGAIIRSWGKPFTMFSASGEIGFWAGFAIFFPAVTGVMAGLGLSGDLRNPGRAIPLGSISGVLTGFAIYMLVPVILALGASASELQQDTMIWLKIAPLGAILILPAMWGAIFSSAVGFPCLEHQGPCRHLPWIVLRRRNLPKKPVTGRNLLQE
ncbi:MAG: hypothetical protein A2Y62_03715 [Candidatus Fischerbacteria bacterium RBG_13_37_8]|uniref:Amino acid permease/ SLC12A domain-containing protein n=1 Tax=Candidatus Fischerbacteria bacterium RBG_13_37_8 TaxID=1817863 RepID=A0A1F5V8C7_9BACT|nr:MAG: hypothetical protein A2Y62_03715 [Candidatus Fischerbacteria bacterium RBG_13_37_8]